jgi:aminoacylase
MRVIFFPGQFSQKDNPRDKDGRPAVTVADDSSPWWTLLKEAVVKAGGELGKVEIFPAATDCRFVRHAGIPGFGFSPMANTPILLHDHNEVTARASCQHYLLNVVLNIVNYRA